jgi:G protein-coupled receptor 157
MSIATYLYLVISKQHRIALKMINIFHVICWGVSLFLVSFAMGFNALGPDKFSETVGWCWIRSAYSISWPDWSNQAKEIFWKVLVGKGIELLSYVFTPVFYILSKRILHHDRSQQLLLNTTPRVRATLQDTDRKLVLIPMVFLFFRIWGSVRFITSVYCPGFLGIYPVALMQGLGDSAQGWANCLLFCFFTTKIRQKFKNLFLSLFTRRSFSQEFSP